MFNNIFLIVLSLVQFFNKCNSNSASPVKGFIIESKFPVIDTIINNQWDVRVTTPVFTRIYYYNDEVMVQQSFESSAVEMVDNAVAKRGPSRISYYSFVFSKNSMKGVFFDSSNLTTARVLKKDSVVNDISALKDNVKETFETTHYKLIFKEIQSNGDLIEEYSLVSKSDSTMTGSCLLRFSGKNILPEFYQISPSFESKRKMRLVEFNVVNNARTFGGGKPGINRFELPQSVKDLRIDNEEEIMRMFEYAKKYISK